jgi:hypothetical protein
MMEKYKKYQLTQKVKSQRGSSVLKAKKATTSSTVKKDSKRIK